MARTRQEAHLPALYKAYQDMQRLDPYLTAYRSACEFVPEEGNRGYFLLRFWGDEYAIAFPKVAVRHATSGTEPPVTEQLLMLHYLLTADGTLPADRWIAFRELPGGLGYYPAFQGRSAAILIRRFGDDLEGFIAAAMALGGDRLTYGDAAFVFRVLPRVPVAVVLHRGDEEFPPAANVLFDASAGHYLPTEDLAVLGGLVAARLKKEAQRR